jgi:hypothetical protein
MTDVIVVSLSPSKNLNAEAWKAKKLAAWEKKALANYVACWEVELAKELVSSRASKNSGFPQKVNFLLRRGCLAEMSRKRWSLSLRLQVLHLS